MVRRWIPLALVCTAVASVGVASAESQRSPADKVVNACKNADATAEAACLERALKGVETGLDEARKKALETIKGGALAGDDLKKALELFDAGEKAWASYRAAQCDAYGLYDKAIGGGGTAARWTCLINETVYRTSTMNTRFSSE
jgi:uncharacterized protein YecT (DUF1311 family)